MRFRNWLSGLTRRWSPSPHRRNPAGKRRLPLALEPLEEKILLAGEPLPAIVVGRTLSSYTTAGVQNNQLTITYTVYNEQADPISGVLLTDTLQPGVTFQNASQLPDRNGQELAWSLGTINGFDRASVTLTVSLANPVPLQLDVGARAFGTLNAGMVTDDAPAAALRPGAVAADLLASTPDANTTDPFVQEKAAALDYDPQRIFDYLNTEVGYESYTGSLRGARGTLWSNAGNSLDEASLGVALFRASGIPARYARGTLSDPLSQQLILSMFPQSFQTVGYIPAGTDVADPANDPDLLAETRDHFWLQIDLGSGFQDADTSGLPGSEIGMAFTTPTSTFTEVADGLRHKVEVMLNVEIWSQAATAFGLGDGLSPPTPVLDHTFNVVDLVGRPLSVGFDVSQSVLPSPIFVSRTTTYTPYLVLNDQAFTTNLADANFGTAFQEVLTNFPLGTQVVTGVFLRLTLTTPGGTIEMFERAVFDRIGFAARRGAGGSVSVDPNAQPPLSRFDTTTVSVMPGLQNPSVAEGLRLGILNQAGLIEETGITPADIFTLARSELAGFGAASDGLTANFASLAALRAYFDRPRLTAFVSRLTGNSDQARLTFTVDLIRNSIRAVAAPGQNSQAAIDFAFARGVADSVIEGQLLAGGSDAVSGAYRVLKAASDQGIPTIAITATTLSQLDGLALPAEAVARITTAVQAGQMVYTPVRGVTLDGGTASAWWELNPATGEVIAVAQNGTHGALIQLPVVYTASTLLVLLPFGGSLVVGPGIFSLTAFGGALVLRSAAKGVLGGGATAAAGATQAQFPGIHTFIGTLAVIFITVVALLVDPPLPPIISHPNIPFPDAPGRSATANQPASTTAPAGAVAGTVQAPAAAVAGGLTVGWTGVGTNGFLVDSLTATEATVKDATGAVIGTGAVGLSLIAPAVVAVTAGGAYRLTGRGRLSVYAAATAEVGAAGDWETYSATVDSGVSVALTADGLTLNGSRLPAGAYTVSAAAAAFTGRGTTAVPTFTGSASIDVTDGMVSLAPATGPLTVAGTAVDVSAGVTLAGFTGTLGVAPAGAADTLTVQGTAANLVQVTTSATTATADQNLPASFDVVVATSTPGTYALTADAPPGWVVTIDATGRVTVTPAAGLQGGTYTVRLTARSVADPALVAQAAVSVSLSPTLPALSLAVDPDTSLTVPTAGSAQSPTAFRASIHNLGPAADTYTLSVTNLPAGFDLVNSGTSVTVPAGETGILGLYLRPNGATLPAPGTPVSFTVTATSMTNPVITETKTVNFTMPEVHGLTLTADPEGFGTLPGVSVTSTLFLKAVGNVSETVNLSAVLSTGLTAIGLPPTVTLNPGQTHTIPVTLTVATAAPLNSYLSAAITAKFNPLGAVFDQTVQIPVRVVVPGADATANASVAAQRLGNTDLADRLGDLSTALTNLVQNPTSDVFKGQALANIDALLGMLASDPFQASFTPELTNARGALDLANNAVDIQAAVVQLGDALMTLDTTLTDELNHRFTLGLGPNRVVALPGSPATFDVFLQNSGALPTTYNFSITGLPANVMAAFTPTSVTLNPGEQIPFGSNRVTLSLTQTGNQLLATGFTVTATAQGAPAITQSAAGSLTLRPDFVSVTEVSPSPTFTDPGGQVQVTAKVLNAVNREQLARVSYTVQDANGQTVFTSPVVPFTLGLQTSLATVDLGSLNTTGFVRGSYTLNVTVTTDSGTPIPGGTGHGTLLVGSPVTASVSVNPATLPPGNATVTNTLTVDAQTALPDLLTLTGQVATTPVTRTMALAASIAYLAGTNGVDIVDVSDPAQPQYRSTFAAGLIVTGGKAVVRRLGTDKLVVGSTAVSNANQFTLLIFSIADPLNPVLISNTTFPHQFLQDIGVLGNTLLVPTAGFAGGNQLGDVIALNVSDPANPVETDRLFGTQSPPNDGSFNQPRITVVNATTAYVASTNSVGTNFDNGVGRVLIVDSSNPANLTTVREVLIPGTSRVEAIALQGNRALVVSSIYPSSARTLTVLDTTNPRDPQILGTTVVTDGVFPSSDGQGSMSAVPLAPGRFAFSYSEVNGVPKLFLVNASDPNNITTSEFSVPGLVNEMAVTGNLLYTTGPAGLVVYTVNAIPAPLTLAGAVATVNPGDGVAVRGTVAYVTGTRDISIVNVSDPANPTVVRTFAGNVLTPNSYNIAQVSGNFLLIASGFFINANRFNLLIYDLTDPLNPALVSNTPINYPFYRGMVVQGNTVFVPIASITFSNATHRISAQNGDVVAVDISNPAQPRVADVLFNPGSPLGGNNNVNGLVAVNSQVAYAASTTSTGGNTQSGTGRVLVVNTTDPANLSLFGTLDIPGTVQLQGIAVQGNRALVVGSTGGWVNPFTQGVTNGLAGNTTLTVLDISNPQSPQILGSTLVTANQYPLGSNTIKMDVLDLGNGLFAASDTTLNGQPVIMLVDASDPNNLLVGSVPTPSLVQGITASGGLLYVSNLDGLSVYHIGQVLGTPVTVSVPIPKNTGVSVVANSFSTPPTQIQNGADSDTYVWKRSLGFGTTELTISWQSQLTNLQPGDARPVTGAATVAFVDRGTPGTVTLPPTIVSSAQVLGLSPAAQTVRPGGAADFTVTFRNPTANPVTYALSVQGVPSGWVSLDPNVTVAAGDTVDVPLTLTSETFAVPVDYGFTVVADANTGYTGTLQGTLSLAGTPMLADPEAHGVVLALVSDSVSAGQGTAARYVVRVTNTGTATDTFDLTLTLPPGVTGALSRNSVVVPPGAGNFREVAFTLTPQPGTAAGVAFFTLTATSATKPAVTHSVDGILNVLASGVQVAMNPPTGTPGSGFQLTVTNMGNATDTFDLSLGGPGGLVASLGTARVTLGPGASQVVPVTTTQVTFAVPGNLNLTGVARSVTNPSVQDSVSATLTVPASSGMTADFSPAARVLPIPSTSTFLLMVHNTGNTEDTFTATITGTDGPVTAIFDGLDGQPTQSVSSFRLPGLSTGALLLRTNLSSFGQGAIQVRVESLTHPGMSSSPRATVIATAQDQTPNPTPAPAVLTGVQVLRTGRRGKATGLELTFRGPLNPASAAAVANYNVYINSKKKQKRRIRLVKVLGAAYDPVRNVVTLRVSKLLTVRAVGLLEIVGVTDTLGRALDGNRDGQPGGLATTQVNLKSRRQLR